MRDYALLYINGRRFEIRGEKAGKMLADFLREDIFLTGTKIVCAEGDCGACTVLRRFPLGVSKERPTSFEPINACITTVAQMDGSHLITVEALAEPDKLHPVQKAMVECHGSQCGFCTPGFVMALAGLVDRRLDEKNLGPITEKEAKNHLTGNLCRCTGYRPILDAACSIDLEACHPLARRYHTPAIEKELVKASKTALEINSEKFSFFAPVSEKEAAAFLSKEKSARIIAAGTDLGVLVNKGKTRLEKCLSLHLIPSLYEIETSKTLTVGARVTLSLLRRAVQKSIPELASFLDLFASPQIKNVATLVGNAVNASPIADTIPFLLAMEAKLVLLSSKGRKELPIERFYLGYKKLALKPGEIVLGISIPLLQKGERLRLRKVSQRKDLDISAVTAAFVLRTKGDKIEKARIALGGVAATPLRLPKTEAALEGESLSPTASHEALAILQKEIKPLSDLRGSAGFRRVVAENLLGEFLAEGP